MATDYWIKREEQKLKAHLTDVTKTEKILHRNLKKASKDIEDEIYKLYSRYSKENRLSYAEANKLLTGPKYKEWRMDLKDYVDEITKTDNKELLLELNTLSAKSSITGLEEQLYQIQKILDREYIFKHKEVKKLLKAGVKNSFTQTAYTIENLNGFHTSFSMIRQKDIEDIINLPWSGKNYSNRLWANRTKLKDKVQEQIVQATIQGKDLRQCIKDVSETMEATREVTKRLINTEHAYACSQGDLKMYEEFGIDRYEYVATLDSKTSNICRGLDGKVYKRSEAISGVNFPPTHPHCRSTTVPADVETLGDETRIAKDIKGNYIYLKANTTYEDYIKALETGNWNNIKDTINESEKSVKIDSKYSNKVDLGYINSKEYKEKFSKISNNETLNNEIYKRTKTILNHRNNTDKEDLCILNAKTGQLVALKSNNKKDLEVHYDKKLLELIKNSPRGTFISIHNHPNNLLPTGSDFVSCGSKGYAFGIVVGHDGSVYKYKHGDKVFRKEFLDSKVEKNRKMLYNSTYKEAQIKVLREFEKSHNISLKEL